MRSTGTEELVLKVQQQGSIMKLEDFSVMFNHAKVETFEAQAQKNFREARHEPERRRRARHAQDWGNEAGGPRRIGWAGAQCIL